MSDVAICNLALSHLGDEAQVVAISPPDGTTQAAQCGQFWPVARQALLELHPWSFATTRAVVAETDNPAPDDWAYAYTLPALCLRPLACLYPGVPERVLGESTDAGSFPYVIEIDSDGDKILLTNVQTATLRYIKDVPDTAKFTPLFTVALARLLASYLAGPILKGSTGMQVAQAQLKIFQLEYAQAAAADANSGRRNLSRTYVPDHIARR